MKDLEDEELIVLSQKGDKQAFGELIQRYKGMVFTIVYRILGNPSEAEDVAQDVFIRAYKALPRFRKEAKFSTWLYRICYNLCITMSKKQKRDAHPPCGMSGNQNSVEVAYERKEIQEKVRSLISELPPIYSSAIILRHIQGLSYKEIAEILGQPLGTTKSTILRGREMLKKLALEKIGWDVIKGVL